MEDFEQLFKDGKKCPTCGSWVLNHIHKEGSRYHVVYYLGSKTVCQTASCEINHNCSSTDGDADE